MGVKKNKLAKLLLHYIRNPLNYPTHNYNLSESEPNLGHDLILGMMSFEDQITTDHNSKSQDEKKRNTTSVRFAEKSPLQLFKGNVTMSVVKTL
jgi:hypothetical protein